MVSRQQQDVIDYLKAENRAFREQLGGKRLRFTDAQRRRLARRRNRSEERGFASSRQSSLRIRCFAGTGSWSRIGMMGARDGVRADLGSPARLKA
jgi:hypothetical protein